MLGRLAYKLKTGGLIYVETPSERTLSLPSAAGFLHFHDDPTHKRLYGTLEMANALLAADCEILRGGTRRDPFGTLVLGPVGVLYNLYFLLRHGRLYGNPLWDLLGVAVHVLAKRRSPGEG